VKVYLENLLRHRSWKQTSIGNYTVGHKKGANIYSFVSNCQKSTDFNAVFTVRF